MREIGAAAKTIVHVFESLDVALAMEIGHQVTPAAEALCGVVAATGVAGKTEGKASGPERSGQRAPRDA